MDKTHATIILILLAATTIQAQTEPAKKSSIDIFSEKLDKVEKNTEKTWKMVEDSHRRMEEIYARWAGTTALAIGSFLAGIYLSAHFLTLIRRRFMLKTHEERIYHLEEELISSKKGLIETLKWSNKETTKAVNETKKLRKLLKNKLKEMPEVKDVDVKAARTVSFTLGILLGLIPYVVEVYNGG